MMGSGDSDEDNDGAIVMVLMMVTGLDIVWERVGKSNNVLKVEM